MTRGAVGVAFAGGGLFALQTRVNGELGARSGSAFWAALVSFGSGLAALAVVLAVVPRLRAAVARAARHRLPWWTYLGGLGGATLVALSAVAVPKVGVATFTVGVVAGQAVGGLLVDRAGLGPGGPQAPTASRVAGAALAVLAVAIIRFGHGGGAVSGATVLAILVASTVAGAMGSVQQALNGRVQGATGEPLVAATVNFAAGLVPLAVIFAVVAATGSGPALPWPPAWWVYAGGLLGIGYILAAIWAVRALGVLRLGLLLVAGQLAGGVGSDLVSPGRTGRPGLLTYVAVVLTIVAVGIAGLQSRSRRATTASATTTPTTR
ncbi:MAG TPA: DMT family transporter [Mycobacteriales bacterium]|nr:DMT family transporter [Mycobacteriales bacterium]